MTLNADPGRLGDRYPEDHVALLSDAALEVLARYPEEVGPKDQTARRVPCPADRPEMVRQPGVHARSSWGTVRRATGAEIRLPMLGTRFPRFAPRTRRRGVGLLVLFGLVGLVGCDGDAGSALRPFNSDGCSWAPDLDFGHCCIVHDFAYWQGGTQRARLLADREFRSCIAATRPGLGAIYYAAVRAFGSPGLPISFRWGFGWTGGRPYGPLSASELAQVGRKSQCFHREHVVGCGGGKNASCKLLDALHEVFPAGEGGERMVAPSDVVKSGTARRGNGGESDGKGNCG